MIAILLMPGFLLQPLRAALRSAHDTLAIVRRVVSLCALLLSAGCTAPVAISPGGGRASPLAYDLLAPNGSRALLLGSIHVARRTDWALPGDLAKLLEHAQILVFEVDLASITAEDTLRLAGDMGQLPPGVQLRDRVSEETWQLLERRAPALGIPLEAIEPLEPWLVALELKKRTLGEAGFAAEHGVEREVWAAAREKPMRGLETLRDQLHVFDALAAPLQERMLRDALEQKDGDTLEALVDAWRRGDRRALEAILFEDRDDPLMAPFHEALYPKRNLRMAGALAEILLHVDSAFVVVGVGHLVGERSLPAALVRRGFRVRERSHAR